MLKARKANRVVKIPDEKKKSYIAMGYTITDMDGNMIHEHVEPSERLEKAEKEIQDLKAQIASAGATEQAATPAPETKKTTKASSKAEK